MSTFFLFLHLTYARPFDKIINSHSIIYIFYIIYIIYIFYICYIVYP